MTRMKCPYCGKEFDVPDARQLHVWETQTPTHDYPPPCRSVCRGSGKQMLTLTDRQPLGKDSK